MPRGRPKSYRMGGRVRPRRPRKMHRGGRVKARRRPRRR